MNYQIQIENLGAIEKAEFTITPMTILAGKNGTGKSFVTKFLYSVLKVLNEDSYGQYILEFIYKSIDIANQLIDFFEFKSKVLHGDIPESSQYISTLIDTKEFLENSKEIFHKQQKIFHKNYTSTLETLCKKADEIHHILRELSQNNMELTEKSSTMNFYKNTETMEIYLNSGVLSSTLDMILDFIDNPTKDKTNLIIENLIQDIKSNFQVSEIKELIRFSATKATFIIESLIEVFIENNSLNINILSEKNVLELQNIPNITFFESPVYWKLLKMIELADNKSPYGKQIITGLPKHFYDLKELLFTDYIDGERPKFIEECAEELEQYLQGKFRSTMGSDLVFENKKGQAINKSLVSFGMTNLGILQAVLNKNIINKGSFIFIDEPESNLHPEWQTILAETLVKLAENGVYVIVTSHSTDMLKAFDVTTQEQKLDDKLSTHYFQMDGKLLAMDDEYLSDIEQARQKLMENYDYLTMRGYLL